MSDPAANTVFVRLEGPLQSWGDSSKFVMRRTAEAPTKSGVLGLICCAMGLSRQAAAERLGDLNGLCMAVRVDRPGTRWWDYHTVGAGYGLLTAEGKVKKTATTGEYETLVSRREYLCDASFLVALQADAEEIAAIRKAMKSPVWPVFLGRKSCPPATPILAGEANCGDLLAALGDEAQPWLPRWRGDKRPAGDRVDCLVEWRASCEGDIAPPDAEVWYDAPLSFDPPVHQARLVERMSVAVRVGDALQRPTLPPPRPRADYGNREYERRRKQRLEGDHGLCVFCKLPATTVQHVTYRRAGGFESPEDLRSLCRLCHDAVTMIEYGLNMGLDRINPDDPQWRERIIAKRKDIVEFRSLATRRRRLSAEEVE